MNKARDPRILELGRLRLALEAASKHLDEFEMRALVRLQVKNSVVIRPPQKIEDPENRFALHVASGMAKLRQG